MLKAMLELDFKFCIEFSIEIPDRIIKGSKDCKNIFSYTIEIDVQNYVGTGF